VKELRSHIRGKPECDGQGTTTEPCLVRCCCRSSCKCSVYAREPRFHIYGTEYLLADRSTIRNTSWKQLPTPPFLSSNSGSTSIR